MIERARKAEIPGEIILADSVYGDRNEFRQGMSDLGLDYAVGIKSQAKVRGIGNSGRLGEAQSVGELAKTIPRRQRRKLRWREGSTATLGGRFSLCRVKTTHEDGRSIEDREPVWLVIEWPPDDEQAMKLYLATLPRRMSHKRQSVYDALQSAA